MARIRRQGAGRRVAALLAAALLAGAGPVAAQSSDFVIPGVTANPAILDACLASGKSAATCLGAMTVDCRAENDLDNANLEERLCIVEELNAWRRLADGQEAALVRRLVLAGKATPDLPGDPAEMVRAARRLWQDWIAEQCRAERHAVGRDPRRAIYEDTCLRDLWAARHDRLRQMARRLGER